MTSKLSWSTLSGMGITVAEVLILLLIGAGIYNALRPIQRWLERKISSQLKGRRHNTVIDITPRKK